MTDDDLRAEIDALRTRLAALEAHQPQPATTIPPATAAGRVSRRGLLAAAVAGGAGLVAAQVTTASPAAAAPGNSVVLGAANDGGTAVTIITSATGTNAAALGVINPDTGGGSLAVYGQLGDQSGLVVPSATGAVTGDSRFRRGVTGLSQFNDGVLGKSVSASGVYGTTSSTVEPGILGAGLAIGVRGYADGGSGSAGVQGFSTSGRGVDGSSAAGEGVYGEAPLVGVHGVSSTGDGAYGRSTSGTGVHAYSSSGTGVQATGDGTAPGVDATSNKGYGVVAKGGRAPLRLVPSAKAGKPTTGSHVLGELYVDKAGVLFLCTVAGTPGTWKKVALV
ncbi:hypothetical protein ACXR2U_05565 [Jatrophihabitans sp. YIM 134969]